MGAIRQILMVLTLVGLAIGTVSCSDGERTAKMRPAKPGQGPGAGGVPRDKLGEKGVCNLNLVNLREALKKDANVRFRVHTHLVDLVPVSALQKPELRDLLRASVNDAKLVAQALAAGGDMMPSLEVLRGAELASQELLRAKEQSKCESVLFENSLGLAGERFDIAFANLTDALVLQGGSEIAPKWRIYVVDSGSRGFMVETVERMNVKICGKDQSYFVRLRSAIYGGVQQRQNPRVSRVFFDLMENFVPGFKGGVRPPADKGANVEVPGALMDKTFQKIRAGQLKNIDCD